MVNEYLPWSSKMHGSKAFLLRNFRMYEKFVVTVCDEAALVSKCSRDKCLMLPLENCCPVSFTRLLSRRRKMC